MMGEAPAWVRTRMTVSRCTFSWDEIVPTGQSSAWCDYSGPVAAGKDGGPDVWAGITIHDDAANPHYPTPWMCREDGWFSPAFKMVEPFTLKPGAKLVLRYRIVAHDGAEPAA